MFRLLVLFAILTFVEPMSPFPSHCHTHPPFYGNPCPGINPEDFEQDYSPESSEEFQPYRRHCHTHPPFYGNPCPGINQEDFEQDYSPESSEEFQPYRRHCHTHPPFYGNPCPGINPEDFEQDYSPESSEEFQPYRRHCRTHPPFYGNPCPGITDDSNQESSAEDFKPSIRHCHTHPPFYGNPCPGVVETSGKPNKETQLQTIEKELTEQEEKLHQFCRENSKNATELYGTSSYFLQYDMPEASTYTVKVQIKHKFIHTSVTKSDGSNEIIFEDVKTVPDIANSGAATWVLHNNKDLKIMIPYKVPLETSVPTSCGVVNNKVIDVPKVVYSPFIYKFGE